MDKPLKILSIENDEFMKIFLKDIFWMHGGGNDELNVVNSIDKAKSFLKEVENRPDLILIDVAVSKRDGENAELENGFKFLEELKSQPQTKNIPVVVFSSFADKEIKDKALKLGACEFMVKGNQMPQDILKTLHCVV